MLKLAKAVLDVIDQELPYLTHAFYLLGTKEASQCKILLLLSEDGERQYFLEFYVTTLYLTLASQNLPFLLQVSISLGPHNSPKLRKILLLLYTC